MRLIAFALLAAMVSLSAHADGVYKWTDKNGNVHYGDKPKEGGQQVDVKPSSGSGSPDAKLDAEHAAQCDKAKAQLESYKKASIIKETNALGQERTYSSQEKQQLIAKAEKDAADACAPPKTAP